MLKFFLELDNKLFNLSKYMTKLKQRLKFMKKT